MTYSVSYRSVRSEVYQVCSVDRICLCIYMYARTAYLAGCVSIWHILRYIWLKKIGRTRASAHGRSRVRESGTSGHAAAH